MADEKKTRGPKKNLTISGGEQPIKDVGTERLRIGTVDTSSLAPRHSGGIPPSGTSPSLDDDAGFSRKGHPHSELAHPQPDLGGGKRVYDGPPGAAGVRGADGVAGAPGRDGFIQGARYITEVLADHPIIYHRMGELSGAVAIDISGNARNGAYTGGFTLNQPGVSLDGNASVGFDGLTALLTTAEISGLFADASVTLEAWVKFSAGGGGEVFCERGSAGWAASAIEVQVSGQVLGRVWDTFGVNFGVITDFTHWHHLVLTYDGAAGLISTYLDSVPGGTRAFTRKVPVDAHVTNTPPTNVYYEVGNFTAGGTSMGNQVPFAGFIDEVAVYKTALSAVRVAAHYIQKQPDQVVGPSGLDGRRGPEGMMGPPGLIGPTGKTGLDGRPGMDGRRGNDGQMGPPGPVGPTGANGATGATGAVGPVGPPGLDGRAGAMGPMGQRGDTGPTGAAGAGATAWTKFTKDLGVARSSGTFDIAGLAGLTADKPVQVVQTADAIASKGNSRDEFEVEPIVLTGYVVDAATIRVYWHADGICVGTYAFAYSVTP